MLFCIFVSVPVHTHVNTWESDFSCRQISLCFFFNWSCGQTVTLRYQMKMTWPFRERCLWNRCWIVACVWWVTAAASCSDASLRAQSSYTEGETSSSVAISVKWPSKLGLWVSSQEDRLIRPELGLEIWLDRPKEFTVAIK